MVNDFVVTVPKTFTHPDAPGKKGLAAWVAEGDPAGSEWSGREWVFSTFGANPTSGLVVGKSRLYVVCEGRLRGYAPITSFGFSSGALRGIGYVDFVRRGGAVACTIPESIRGFRGWRWRWWRREDEIPFPEWKQP